MKILKIGDKVLWRGAWGNEPAKEAKVKSIELCERRGEKEGKSVLVAKWADAERLVVDLDCGHWAYGYQISPLA